MCSPIVISKYSTWLSALRSHPNEELKYNYIKLLIMGLDHPEQVYPFNEYPPAKIEPIDVNDWLTAAKNIFFDNPSFQPTVSNPSVVTAVSDDKCQFAAYQTIPKVGIQCYYAQSDDPLQNWLFKYNSLSVAPTNPIHAIPLDWERSLAGIRRIKVDPYTSRYPPNAISVSLVDVSWIEIIVSCVTVQF